MANKPKPFFRWLIFLLVSFAMFGNYYIYDSISPLADVLKAQLGFSDVNIGTLMAIYSFPNIIMVVIGGFVIDRIGARKSVLIFSLLIVLGTIITALRGNIYSMATGRLIFGIGAESMIVAINIVLVRWFKSKELSFAFGLNLTIARFGSFMAINSPSWGESLYYHWQHPLFVTVGAAAICIISVILFIVLDIYSTKRYDFEEEEESDKVVIGDLFKLGRSFWFITLLCVTFYSAMFPFQTFAVKFFKEMYGTTRGAGGFLSSILTFSSMVFTPLFGLLADKIGKRSLLMMFGSLLIVPVYLLMGYKVDIASALYLGEWISVNIGFLNIHETVSTNIFIPMALMGIAFSLVPAVMWPAVALIVKQSKLGTAYGLMTMIQNIGLFGFNLIIGWANDFSNAGVNNPNGYRTGLWIFSILGFLGLLFAFMLRRSESGSSSHGLEAAMD